MCRVSGAAYFVLRPCQLGDQLTYLIAILTNLIAIQMIGIVVGSQGILM